MKLIFSISILLSVVALRAENLVLTSTEKPTPLIELFTSEGCSSCPPAETWLSSLVDDENLWREFVPVAFHVDYWDYLGWRDPFSQHENTERQRAYAALWHSANIYTPGLVRQGQESRDWQSGKLVGTKAKAGILTCAVGSSGLSISYSEPGNWDVHVCRLGFGIDVNVTAGENSGRKLRHDFVALSHQTETATHFPLLVQLAHAKPASNGREALAIWISPHGSVTPVQAVGGWLPH